MKNLGIVGGLSLGVLMLAASNAHADPYWLQQPGLAKEIGVDAHDTPFIVDINGNVQYGTAHQTCGGGFCFDDGTVDWHMLAGTAAHIGVAIDSSVWITGTNGEMYVNQNRDSCSYTPGTWMGCFQQWYGISTTLSSGAQASIGQFALGTDTFGVWLLGGSQTWTMYGLSSNLLQKLTPTVYETDNEGHLGLSATPTTWQYDGAAGSVVALFSENSGSVTTQVPWTINAFGFPQFGGPGGFVQVERPTWSGGGAVGPVTYLTDSWMLAGNWVWHWKAGAAAERKTGVANQDYDEVFGGSASMQITRIAFANPYPTLNWLSGSRLWAIDSQNRIYTLENADFTPPQ